MPKVSILIPTYNYARFISEALDSILLQTYQDFEVIISDDASTDNTQEVVAPYLVKDSRIKYVRHENNLGMVQNWNWTLKQADGEYVHFLFADDKFLDVTALSQFVDALDRNPHVSIVASARYAIDLNSIPVAVLDGIGRDGVISGDDVVRVCLIKDQNLVGEPSVSMFRKALAIRGFDETYRQLVDLEMWFYLCSIGCLFYINKPLCGFRCHPDQQTAINNKSGRTYGEGIRIFRDYFSLAWGGGCYRFGFYMAIFVRRKNIKKKISSDPELKFHLNFLDENLPLGWLFFCWAWYRVCRPFYNLKRSVLKRINVI